MKASGLIQVNKRGPFLNPIQLAPKSSSESRFVLDASHLTRHLSAPSFRLDPLPKVLLQDPLPPSAFFTKVDLAEAFYHITLHPQAQRLTNFRLDGIYYSFKRLPFGIRPAPFVMQTLATAIARTLRSQRPTQQLLSDLYSCGFRVNPKDNCVVPSRQIRFLGFSLDSETSLLAHTPQQVKSLKDTLQLLCAPQSLSRYQRLAGLWYGPSPPRAWCAVFEKLWERLPRAVSFVPAPPTTNFFADASSTGFGVITEDAALAVITKPSRHIFLREAVAWLLAALLAPPRTEIHTDNLALCQAITSGHLHSLPIVLLLKFLSFICHAMSKPKKFFSDNEKAGLSRVPAPQWCPRRCLSVAEGALACWSTQRAPSKTSVSDT
ncbi:hypothetical protein HPB47_024459 [Ixodes persulcatus]|uniref:Uncharacterized protein n=1 Tax=Ixodes persulcatus TaxID=34615 RepID=A0AC60Q4A8_IXOPE|nr:hypothetical protein HPB47_024459 [Ixodes persulcatus]